MIGDAPKSPHTGLPGWETEAEEELLTRYAADVPDDGVIVEIGGEWGRSAGAFARGAKPQVQIFTVDLFPGELLDQHRANLDEAGFGGRTIQLQGDSKAIGRADQGLPISLLFIDGDHTYEGVKADIENWAKFVTIGGFIIFHDVAQVSNKMPHMLHFEVTRAISDWLNAQSDFEAIEAVDTAAVFRRVKLTPQVGDRGAYYNPDAKFDPSVVEGRAIEFERLPDLPQGVSFEQLTDESSAEDVTDEPPADLDELEATPEEGEAEAVEDSPLNGMTKAELKQYAEAEGIDLTGTKTHPEIVDRITTELERRRQA